MCVKIMAYATEHPVFAFCDALSNLLRERIAILEGGPKTEAGNDLLIEAKRRLSIVEALLANLTDISTSQDANPKYHSLKQDLQRDPPAVH